MTDGIGIALIGLGSAALGAAISGFSVAVAAGMARRGVSYGLVGLIVSLGAMAGLVGGVLFGSAAILGGRFWLARDMVLGWREVEILSDRGWQDAGLVLREGQEFRLEYVSGQ